MHAQTSAALPSTYGSRGRSLADLSQLGHVRVLSRSMCPAGADTSSAGCGHGLEARALTGKEADQATEHGHSLNSKGVSTAQGWALKVLSGARASVQGMLRAHASILSQCGYTGLPHAHAHAHTTATGAGTEQHQQEGGRFAHASQAWHGTLVTVTDLFHSLPVRKRAHSPKAELERLLRSITHLSLIHPGVQWVVEDSRACTEVLRLHRCSTTLGRLAQCYGSGRIAALNLSHVSHSTTSLLHASASTTTMPLMLHGGDGSAGQGTGGGGVYKLSGYVGTGYHTKELQLLFLNGHYARAVPELQAVIEKAAGAAGSSSQGKGSRRSKAGNPAVLVQAGGTDGMEGQENTDPMSLAPFGVSLAAGAHDKEAGSGWVEQPGSHSSHIGAGLIPHTGTSGGRGQGQRIEKGAKRGEAAARDARQGYLAYVLDLRYIPSEPLPSHTPAVPAPTGTAEGHGMGGMEIVRDGSDATLVYFHDHNRTAGQSSKAAVTQLLIEAVRAALGLPIHPSASLQAATAGMPLAGHEPATGEIDSLSIENAGSSVPTGPVATAMHVQEAQHGMDHVKAGPGQQHNSSQHVAEQGARYGQGDELAVDFLGRAPYPDGPIHEHLHVHMQGSSEGPASVPQQQHNWDDGCWECLQAAGTDHGQQYPQQYSSIAGGAAAYVNQDDSLDDLLFIRSPAKPAHASEGGAALWPPREDTLGASEADSAPYVQYYADVQLDTLSAAGLPTSALPWLPQAEEDASAAATAAMQHRQQQLRVLTGKGSSTAGAGGAGVRGVRVPTYGGLALRVAQGKPGHPGAQEAQHQLESNNQQAVDESERVTSAFFPLSTSKADEGQEGDRQPSAKRGRHTNTLSTSALPTAEVEKALAQLYRNATAPAAGVGVAGAPRLVGGGTTVRYTDTFVPAVGLAALKPGLAVALKQGGARKHYGSTTDVASIAYSQRLRALNAAGAGTAHAAGAAGTGRDAPAVKLPQALLAQVGKPVTRSQLQHTIVHPSCYVGQLDNKFLLLSIPLHVPHVGTDGAAKPTDEAQQPYLQQLVIVDQHAADERARLETLEIALFGAVPVLDLLPFGRPWRHPGRSEAQGGSTGDDSLVRMVIEVSADGLTVSLSPLPPLCSCPSPWRVSAQAWHACTMATPVLVDFTPAERAVLRSCRQLIEAWGFQYRMEEYVPASLTACSTGSNSSVLEPNDASTGAAAAHRQADVGAGPRHTTLPPTSSGGPRPAGSGRTFKLTQSVSAGPSGSKSVSLATAFRPGSAFRAVIPNAYGGRPFTALGSGSSSAVFQSSRMPSTPRPGLSSASVPSGGTGTCTPQAGTDNRDASMLQAATAPAEPQPAVPIVAPATGKVWVTSCPGLWDQVLSIEDLRDFIAVLSSTSTGGHGGGAGNTKAHLTALEAAAKATSPEEPPAAYIHRVRSALYSHGCKPPAISRILNSKACRGAVMFGDGLPRETALGILQRIASPCIKFPFQCAHGRPAMIPLLTLASSSGSTD